MLDYLYNVIEKIKDLPQNKQKELLTYFEKIASEKEFEKIVENIFSIENETIVTTRTRQNTLERINRFTQSAKTPHEFHARKKSNYLPIVNEGELIEIRFSGLGSETDQEHFAIIWKAQRTSDPIVIIPTTSFKEASTKETEIAFNIGKIDFMGKETVVLLDQMTTISRKRINRKTLYKTRQTIDKTKGQYKFATISIEQKNRILDGLRAYHFGETTIYQFLKETEQKKLPVLTDYEVQIKHLHRPFIKNIEKSNADEFVYALYENPNKFYTIYRCDCTEQLYKRNQLLNTWINATAEYDEETKIIIKTRHLVQKDAYDKMFETLILECPLKIPLTTK